MRNLRILQGKVSNARFIAENGMNKLNMLAGRLCKIEPWLASENKQSRSQCNFWWKKLCLT